MRNSFSQSLSNSQIKNSNIRALQPIKEGSKLSTLQLSKNSSSNSSVKRINLLEFKQNVQKELEIQKRKLEEMQKKDFPPTTQEYFSNVYGPLTNKLSSIKKLRNLMQRNKEFDEAHFSIGCPCFHHSQKKAKKLFADQSWFNGKTEEPDDREMMLSSLDSMVSDIYDDIQIDEGIIVGQISNPVIKKKGKINMLRERFNEVLIDEGYPEIEKINKIMGHINKPTKGKIIHFSMFEIEAGDIIKFDFENKGVLTGKQYMNKIDYLEMSQFYLEIVFLEKDNVQDVLNSSRPSSASSSSNMSTQLSTSSGFCRKKQSHFQIQLRQKFRNSQFSHDAIEAMRQLKVTDPSKLYRILTTYDPVYQESIISLSIIIRDIPLMNFLFTEIFSDQSLTNKEGFFKYASIEIFNGFQKVSFRFEKDKKFFLELQKRLLEQKEIQISEFFFIQDRKLDYIPTYGNDELQFSLILRQRSKSYLDILNQCNIFSFVDNFKFNFFNEVCDFKNLAELEFSKNIFQKLMIEKEENIDNIDLGLEYYRDLYFKKFVLPDKFENNKFQSLFFGSSKIQGGKKATKQNKEDIRFHNILHNLIQNKQNIDDIIRRYDETFVLFTQKDSSGNTPGQLLFKIANSDQILDYVKQAGIDSVKEFVNDQGDNILHSLYQNKKLANSEDILGLLGQEIVNQLKNAKNKNGLYPLTYFLKTNIRKIKFSTLNLIIPTFEEQDDSVQFIRNELLPIINSCTQNFEVMQFLINKVPIFQLIYKYPPAIAKYVDMKQIYDKLMQNLLDDEYYFIQGYKTMNLKQLQWFVEKNRFLIHKFVDQNHPIYDWYVRKRLESDTSYQESSILTNKNSKIKKKQTLQSLIALRQIKKKLRSEEVLKMTEPLPKSQVSMPSQDDIKWSNKIFNPNQDRQISKYFSRLFTKSEKPGQYSSFYFNDYQAQKHFFCNLENYQAKKQLLFEKLKKLDKNFIFHFKQTHNVKNSEFILDLDKLGFLVIVEIQFRPFTRYDESSPILKNSKWFQTKEEFKKLMIQKYCNHLTNIPFQIAKDDSNKEQFKNLLERLNESEFMTKSLLELFLYQIIEGNAAENFRILSEYYFEMNTFLRWCRVLKINPSTAMIQVILDQELIPPGKLIQMLCFRRYNHKLIEQNIFANLDFNQIEITQENDNDANNNSQGEKKKLKISQLMFDILCVKAKVKHFTKTYEWSLYMIESSSNNSRRLSRQNKRYIFSQNWPDLWEKINDNKTHAGVFYSELSKKLKEKKQYKINNGNQQQQNIKNGQQGDSQSLLITNKDYFKKCIEVLSSKIRNSTLARIIMICIDLGKPKWAQKLFSYSQVYQYQIQQLLRFYNLNLQQYKLIFQQQSFIVKDKQQHSQIENLKNIVKEDQEAFLILKKLEKNEQFGQIQQWIQRVSEEFRYQLAHFFIKRYVTGLIANQENQLPRKQIKVVKESLQSEKFIKKQQEYAQKLEQLIEKNQKKMSKFKKEHSYNLLTHKEEPNKQKYGNYQIALPQNKSLKVLFGSPALLNSNNFQIEQLFDTCLEIYYSKDVFYVQNSEISYEQFLKNLNEKDQNEQEVYQDNSSQIDSSTFSKIIQYLKQRPDKIIGIIQKMKYKQEEYIKELFSPTYLLNHNKKFNENIEYLSSKLIIKEYISNETAESMLFTFHNHGFYQNQTISAIYKNFDKEITYQRLNGTQVRSLFYTLPIYLIECKNWIANQFEKNGFQILKNQQKNEEKLNIGGGDELSPSQDVVEINNLTQQDQLLYETYLNILIEFARRQAQRIRLNRQFKRQPHDQSKIQEISQFNNDLLNFELADIIAESDLYLQKNYFKIQKDRPFGDYLIQHGLLVKGDQVDERLIQYIQNNPKSMDSILASQDHQYVKVVFDKIFQGKRSLVEEYMEKNEQFQTMIKKCYKEEFIEKIISYYYRKGPNSLKLVELSIQNNKQKIFFTLIRSESDRNQIKQIIQNQYLYIKVFRLYDIINFAINELEILSFQYSDPNQQSDLNSKQEDENNSDENKILLADLDTTWLSLKLILAQESQMDKYNKTQKMFIMLRNILIETLNPLLAYCQTLNFIGKLDLLSELVFGRSKEPWYKSDLAIIQSELLKNQILLMDQSFKEQSVDQTNQTYSNDKFIYYFEYSSNYPKNVFKNVLIKPYQKIYWLKYRHGQSNLSFDQPKVEEFIKKVRDTVNKFGPQQIDFNATQMKQGIQNEYWLYYEVITKLSFQKNENYIIQLANLFNPKNNTLCFFMFQVAIYNPEIFIKLIPKLKETFSNKQIEELLLIYLRIYLSKKVKVENIQVKESLKDFTTYKPKHNDDQSQIQNENESKSEIERADKIDSLDIAKEAEQKEQSDQLQNEMKQQDDNIKDSSDQSQNYFKELKSLIENYQECFDYEKNLSDGSIASCVPLELQNALIILIKCFNPNLYSKILCDIYIENLISLKMMVFILDHASQNIQMKCINQLAKHHEINLKNFTDIRQYEQILYFYNENVSKLLDEPYNVKKIEIIQGNVNKYQYFSSQNMIITLNYINVYEFENFIMKEFESTNNIEFIPFDDIKIMFNMRVSSKNFGNNQYKTQLVNEYFEKQFQYEIKEDESYFRNWCDKYTILQQAQIKNFDIVTQQFADKQKSDQEYDQIVNQKLADQIKYRLQEQNRISSSEKTNDDVNKSENEYITTSLFAREIVFIAKEIQSSEYAKLLSPYERIKTLQGQLLLEKEMKNENTYFVYFYFESNKTHVINTFQLTNIYLQKILDQNQIQSSLDLDMLPLQQPQRFIRQFENNSISQKSDFFYEYEFDINQESIKSEKNQNLAAIYCQRYLKYEMYIGLSQRESFKNNFNDYVRRKFNIENFKIRYICYDINQEGLDYRIESLNENNEDQTIKIALLFDFSVQPIKVTNTLFNSERINSNKQFDVRKITQPVFLTQFNSILEIYRHQCVIDFISYFNTLVMNCSQLKLMYSYIPSQIKKAIQIISQNAHKYGFEYIMIKFTTTNQPFNLKSDCFKDHSDKIIRLGQTTYEVSKPLEDSDSQKFKLPYQILKVTLSLAFKHPTKEFTAPEKKDDDIEHYFYKITNEYDLIKSVCSNRDILRKLFEESVIYQSYESYEKKLLEKQQKKLKKQKKQKKPIAASRQNSQNLEEVNMKENQSQTEQDGDEEQEEEVIFDENSIFNLQKLDQIIPSTFENSLKDQNDLQLYYSQVIQKIKQIEVYFLLYKYIDLENYKQIYYDDIYNKTLIDLILQQKGNDLESFYQLQRQAYKSLNSKQLKKDFNNIISQPIKPSSQQSYKFLKYQFNKIQTFQYVYPSQKVQFTLIQSKIMEYKYEIRDFLYQYNVSYKGEDKWNQLQWNSIFDSCDGLKDANNLLGYEKLRKQIIRLQKPKQQDSLLKSKLESKQMLNIDLQEIQQLQLSNYFSNVQFVFTEISSSSNQSQDKEKKQNSSDNIKVQIKSQDENSTKENKTLILELTSTSQFVRQDTVLYVLRALLTEIKNGLPNQVYSPQSENNRQKVMRIHVITDQKQEQYKFKKKIFEMNSSELVQAFYFITLLSYYKKLANQVKKPIKLTFQTGLKKPIIKETQACFKIKMSSFQTVNMYQLILQDTEKPKPKCGLYSINHLTHLKNETVSDITNKVNWSIEQLVENQNKFSIKSLEVKQVDIDPTGSIKFSFEDNTQAQPIYVKFIYKKQIAGVYLKKENTSE